MNRVEWFLLAVVAVAFVAGYSVVNFIVKKMKSQNQTTEPPDGKSEGPSEGTGRTNASQESNRDNHHHQREQEQARRPGETSESQTEEQRHARVLGLSGKITPADVKRAYHELLAKY